MKKSKERNEYMVKELKRDELKQLNGGILWLITLIGGAILTDAILSGRESTDALMRGYKSTQ
ncbi:MAG: hypothetical protein WCY58_11070 [Mariniphaga sp.]|nr:hypothetical protein [Mariniphaga sp.]